MNHHQVGRLRFLWIAILSGFVTLWACTKIIFGSYLVKNYRPYVDLIMQKWSNRLLTLVKAKVQVTGIEHFPKEPNQSVIVVCNHTSLYDIPISQIALNTSLRMLTKKELYKIPIFATALKKGEFVSVDRHNHENALKDLQRAKEKMRDGITLWVAPEGTRSNGDSLLNFKTGGFHLAIDTKAMIVPLVIQNAYSLQAGKNLSLNLHQTIKVELLAPIDASNTPGQKAKELAQQVRQKMLECLQKR